MTTEPIEHYHGDTIRKIFVTSGVIILCLYPFFRDIITLPLPFTFLAILALAISAGIINPKQLWTMIGDAFISITGFIVFEYTATSTYIHLSFSDTKHLWFFVINQFLALCFFAATYLSFKTIRGELIRRKEVNEEKEEINTELES